ncbi:hypothetical protein SLA2020_236470 [Shorea laevis]
MGDNMNMFHYGSGSSSDDMSHFVRQILVHSSSMSAATAMAHGGPQARGNNTYSPGGSMKQGILGVDGCEWGGSGSGAGLLGDVRGSCSVGGSENDTDEYDCESEEHLEAVVDEAPAKPAPSRGSSKRSRAAEVHNLSEKRRRSRINEKMKALQNLIPNSNKTDKASMLDEAIEYLKQLQLQVQMLTMRNGLSLHPMCLPGALPPIQLSQTRAVFAEENESLHMNSSGTLPMNQEAAGQTIFSLPNQCTISNHLPVHNIPGLINPETSYGLESSIQAQFGPFQLLTSSEGICREDVLPHQLNMNHSKPNPSASLPFNESDLIGSDHLEGVLLKNIEHNLILSSHLTRMEAGSSPNNDIKTERPNF